ncbi:alanine dehydrogenase [Fusobacterium animalis]|uniref:alanine dehydrogenase n=1 Tax=Fusobacterium animalis TaxID=76859 RepID=UPI001C6F325F|nr:alanine dehydrogenase [Fusobacterium animalis]QYR68603.1 alanine dehydrogenase [Fusobacterium animalis]
MKIGLLKEIKNGEYRTILTPNEVAELILNGHELFIQSGAGAGASFEDVEYEKVGAKIVGTIEEIYQIADFVTKVKEIEESEYGLLRENQIIFTCIHPAASREEVDALLKAKVIAFTAEDTHRYGSPNCEIAGKLGFLKGVECLLRTNGGSGQLICGAGGAPAANVLIIGAGLVGRGAIDMAYGLGANITVMDINVQILRNLLSSFPGINTMISNTANIKSILSSTDLVVNCVKWPKHRKDHLIYKDMLKTMKKGSVIIDISADIGGAIETYRHTTHENPTYIIDGIVHYGVDNIPGAASKTASIAYAASVIDHIKSIANNGIVEACRKNGYLRRSLTVYKGVLTHEETSVIQKRDWIRPEVILNLKEGTYDIAPPATTTINNN